ncbi:hypothetical protein [Nostoc sp. NMS4]|uniref:hypothetical protein n=1 Tax=Nostoc sp. NMS4 TaxID=2815390 RepID=UPI0025DB3354|nr:hypothetical protein [Nostoc sp. NMS4]MBN3927565.1 hypothetical protein [Nostoc sp. NMS4]
MRTIEPETDEQSEPHRTQQNKWYAFVECPSKFDTPASICGNWNSILACKSCRTPLEQLTMSDLI